ncbi:DUF4326 domain-containing protein [Cereibacter azotoformans]|uniref:DUF4326 domain-containing protein n=1 Tax=Cereibacter azotoformans TaxID=43057 RepID=UPI001EEBC6E5|nr:DUF4326 domain-containing protein [Cereibacter azotoformans]ULB10701.1 DUF4326 domain-containing protein [Cereibacter azotoformans]
MSKRIQLSRAKGWRMPPGAVKVDRSTKWGNPWVPGQRASFRWPMNVSPWFSVATHISIEALSSEEAVQAFRRFLVHGDPGTDLLPVNLTAQGRHQLALDLHIRRERIFSEAGQLRGRDLACWCPPGSPCHADVLLEIANG